MQDKTILNAVIGFPLDHTLSPILHNAIYKELNINAELKSMSNEHIEELISVIKKIPVELTAVTMPYKETVLKFLDEIDPVAKKLHSINTIINRNGILHGYNTDIIGIEKALEKTELKNKNVLIIGAGGVARPVAYHVSQCGGLPLYLNRTKEKAQMLADEFGGKVVEEKDLDKNSIDVIINTTPIGMYPYINVSPLSKELLSPHQTVFDIVYNPLETQLLKDAQEVGAQIISGIEMFVYQGVAQVELWKNTRINNNLIEKIKGKLI